MDIKVLGEGCHDCLRLELLVGQVLADLGIEASLSRIDGSLPDCPLRSGRATWPGHQRPVGFGRKNAHQGRDKCLDRGHPALAAASVVAVNGGIYAD